jgi:hypothetical protein
MSILTPEQDPLSPAQKPASKTLEGKLATVVTVAGVVLTALASLFDQGLLGDGKLAAILGSVLAVAAALGLIAGRTALKIKANSDTAKAAALIEASKAAPPANPTQG